MNYKTKPIPKSMPETTEVSRPWGHFAQYVNNAECTVSLMEVAPGQRLSLQSHTGRGELWIVIDDGALIQIGETAAHYKAGDRVWIPVEEHHRLSNDTDKTIRVLEVAFGNWQQDDITRYADDYNR